MRRLLLGLAIASIAALSPCWVHADDQQIAQQIVQQLRQQKADGQLSGFGIDLEVESGIVWLKGHVRSPDQKALVVGIARRAGGVQQVVDDIEIKQVAAKPQKPRVKPALLRSESTSAKLLKKPGELLTSLRGNMQRAFGVAPKREVTKKDAKPLAKRPSLAASVPPPAAKTPSGLMHPKLVQPTPAQVKVALEKPTQLRKPQTPRAQPQPAKPQLAHRPTPAKPQLAHRPTPAKPQLAHRPTPAKPQLAHRSQPAKPQLAHRPTPAKPQLAHRPAPKRHEQVHAAPVSQVKPTLPSDEQLAETIIGKLRVQKERGILRNFDVDVQVNDRIVWVSGRVASEAQRSLVLDVSRRVRGVKQVVNDLDVTVAAPVQVASATVTPTAPVSMAPISQEPPRPVGTAVAPVQAPAPFQYVPQNVPQYAPAPQQVRAVSQVPRAFAPARSVAYTQPVAGQPVPTYPAAAGIARARFDQPVMPGYAWPSYAAYPNYGAVTYPRQYSPTAWPYIGPFYPYPQVPLGWRKVTLEWDDGWWMLDFKSK